MSEAIKTKNGHGTVKALVGLEAAEQAVRDLAKYMQTMKEEESADTARFFGALNTTATVVGAITGLVGLGKKKNNQVQTVEMELCNGSSYVVVPWKKTTNDCAIKQAPRPLTRGENMSIIADAGSFTANVDWIELVFIVGNEQKNIELSVNFALITRNIWSINKFEVDGEPIESQDIVPNVNGKNVEGLQAIAFQGNQDYPSFSIYSHSIGYEQGKTYLAFLDLAPAS